MTDDPTKQELMNLAVDVEQLRIKLKECERGRDEAVKAVAVDMKGKTMRIARQELDAARRQGDDNGEVMAMTILRQIDALPLHKEADDGD